MKTFAILLSLLLALVGCSSDSDPSATPADAGLEADAAEAPLEASTDAPVEPPPDASEQCETTPGSLACGQVVEALCSRTVYCCEAGGCGAWGESVAACKAGHLEAGLDCSAAVYATAQACASDVLACELEAFGVDCSDLLAGLANWPPSCLAVWSQLGGS